MAANKTSRKGKTYEEIYGSEKAQEIKDKQSKSATGKIKSEEHKKNWSEARQGHEVTEDTRTAISKKISDLWLDEDYRERQRIAHLGNSNPNKGKTYEEIYGEERAEELRQNLKDSHLEYFATHDSPMKEKKHPQKTRTKMSESRKKYCAEHDNPNQGKTYEEIYGEERAIEIRDKIGNAKRDIKLSPEHIENIRQSRIGYIPSQETRDKISATLMGHPGIKGEANTSWKGGISFEPYTPEFNRGLKDFIRERDIWTCQYCGKTQREIGRKLDVHHVDYDKKNCLPENLVALCRRCNIKANYNRDEWQIYFTEGLVKRGIRS